MTLRTADSCGDGAEVVCQWVLDRTGNGKLGSVADWFVGKPLNIVTIIVVALVISRLARRAIRIAMEKSHASRAGMRGPFRAVERDEPRRDARVQAITAIVSSAVGVLIWVTAAFMVIDELGVDLGPLLAGAGIAGIALGFGAQNLVKDCISGLFMLIEDQYGIGDTVDLGDANGVVERISLRTTVLRGLDGTLWHVPNGEVRRVGNHSQ